VCAIARRRLARHYEVERRQAVAGSGLALIGGLAGAAAMSTSEWERDEVERRDEIVRALGMLPAIHRQVLVMKYLDELSVSAIADELGRSPVQIQSLLQRARDGLRRAMEGGEPVD
jgi:RNA polymerase sigma factor (sigma-70 family)